MNRFLNRGVAIMALPLVLAFAMPELAVANSAATAMTAAAAAVIVGAIFYDSSHRPYYKDQSGHSHYVSATTASYYQQHHWSQTPQNQRRWQDQGGKWHTGPGSR